MGRGRWTQMNPRLSHWVQRRPVRVLCAINRELLESSRTPDPSLATQLVSARPVGRSPSVRVRVSKLHRDRRHVVRATVPRRDKTDLRVGRFGRERGDGTRVLDRRPRRRSRSGRNGGGGDPTFLPRRSHGDRSTAPPECVERTQLNDRPLLDGDGFTISCRCRGWHRSVGRVADGQAGVSNVRLQLTVFDHCPRWRKPIRPVGHARTQSREFSLAQAIRKGPPGVAALLPEPFDVVYRRPVGSGGPCAFGEAQ